LKILAFTYAKWFVVSQIAPYLTTTIIIENIANSELGMFLRKVGIIVKNRGKGDKKSPLAPIPLPLLFLYHTQQR